MITKAAALLAAGALLAGCGSDNLTGLSNALVPESMNNHATTAENKDAARAESRQLLTALAPPSGGSIVTSAPSPALRQQQLLSGGADPKLSGHAWWTVPMSRTAFTVWLNSQKVTGLTSDDGSGSSTSGNGVTVDFLSFAGSPTSAYVAPTLTFNYIPHAGGVAVRLDAAIGARFGRSVFIPTDTSRVLIQRTTRLYNSGSKVTSRRAVVTKAAGVRRLVATANSLDGTTTVPIRASCPMQVSEKTYVVTFVGPQGTYTLTGDDSNCFPTLTMRHAGKNVPPLLDPGEVWFPLLRKDFAGR